jgi:hypothetical protein
MPQLATTVWRYSIQPSFDPSQEVQKRDHQQLSADHTDIAGSAPVS